MTNEQHLKKLKDRLSDILAEKGIRSYFDSVAERFDNDTGDEIRRITAQINDIKVAMGELNPMTMMVDNPPKRSLAFGDPEYKLITDRSDKLTITRC